MAADTETTETAEDTAPSNAELEQRVKSLEERLAGMAEQTPQPPERRIERIMWRAR